MNETRQAWQTFRLAAAVIFMVSLDAMVVIESSRKAPVAETVPLNRACLHITSPDSRQTARFRSSLWK